MPERFILNPTMIKSKTVILFALFVNSTTPTFAVPYSEKHAFCVEYYANSNSYYANQKSYNSCMRNADQLIQTHERDARQRSIRTKQNRERIRLEEEHDKQRKENIMRDSFADMSY